MVESINLYAVVFVVVVAVCIWAVVAMARAVWTARDAHERKAFARYASAMEALCSDRDPNPWSDVRSQLEGASVTRAARGATWEVEGDEH